MKGVNLLLIIFIGVFLIGVVCALPANVLNESGILYITGCTDLNESGSYVLNNSITMSDNSTCFNITSSGVNLDGKGFGLIGIRDYNNRLSSQVAYGIIGNGVNYLNISNIQINGFGYTLDSGGILDCGLDDNDYVIECGAGIKLTNTNNSYFSITTSNNYAGLEISGFNNNIQLLSGVPFSNDFGIVFLSGQDNFISGNFYDVKSSVFFQNSSYNNVSSSYFQDLADRAVALTNSHFNRVYSNSFIRCGGDAIEFHGSNNTYFYNNTVSDGWDGIEIWGNSQFNEFFDNSISGSTNGGVVLGGAYNNLFYRNRFSGNNVDILFSNGESLIAEDNFFYNNYFGSDVHFYTDLDGGYSGFNFFNITNSSGENIVGVNRLGGNYWSNSLNQGYSDMCNQSAFCGQVYDVQNNVSGCESNNCDYLPLSNASNFSFSNDYGIITWSTSFSSYVKKSAQVSILENYAYFNSSSASELNTSANITFYNIGDLGFVIPGILKDGIFCSDCYNFTALNADTIIFNVSSWSNYSIGEVAPIIYLFNVLNSTASTREFIFNVSDDSNIANCSLMIYNSNGIAYDLLGNTNLTELNEYSNNSINYFNFVVGTFTSYINCTDSNGHIGKSNTLAFEVQAEEIFSSSSSGFSNSVSRSISDSSLLNGVTRNLGKNDSLKFNVNNQSHSLTVNKISNSSITLTIQSVPQVFTMKLGEIIYIDVNSDGIKDLEVSYLKYYTFLVSLKIKKVSIPVQEVNETKKDTVVSPYEIGNEEDTNEVNRNSNIALRIILTIVLLVIIFRGFRYFFHKRR